MKTLQFVIIGTAIILTSCSSSKQTATAEYDDVYYNPNLTENQAVIVQEPLAAPEKVIVAEPMVQEQVYASSQVYQDENLSDYEKYKLQQEADMLGETYEPQGSEALYVDQYQQYDTLAQVSQYGQESAPVVVNNYYSNPNEYNYSSNLRRFSDDYYGWDYYDPYYTDNYYGGSRMRWGMSMGYGYPGWGMGFSYGYPRYGYSGYGGYGGYYDRWGYGGGYYGGGYYGGGYYGSYYGSYWNGYYNGYNHGYWDASYYRPTPYQYGRVDHRGYYGYSRNSGSNYGTSKGSSVVDPKQRYQAGSSQSAVNSSRNNVAATRSNTQTRSNVAATRSSTQTRSNASATRSNPTNQRAIVKTTRTARPAANVQRSSASSRGNYTPTYSKPRTSSSATYNRSSSNTYKSTTPSRSSSSYSRPSSSPSRSSSSYSRPSSSSSRSSSSYSSSPSRSSSSYSRSSSSSSRSSAPSRSSSSGSSRSSSSSSRSSSSRR